MTAREHKLLLIFLFVCASAGACIYAITVFGRIRNANETSSRYEKTLSGLPSRNIDIAGLEREVTRLEAEYGGMTMDSSPTLTEMTSNVKLKLIDFGIAPSKLAISGKDGEETVEITLRCEDRSFLSFLRATPKPAKGFHYAELTIKPAMDGNDLDVIMRIKHED